MTCPTEPLREGDLLSVQQALRILPISKSGFHRLLESGEIPSVRLGGVGGPRARVLVEWRAALPNMAPRSKRNINETD